MRRTSTPAISGFPTHFVVDGSNIATEGRSAPSLHQLNEAVLAFMEEHPGVLITVVVDATFGHRIDKKEVKEFDLAVANNELVTPPAGAVGRGDAFVLSIANKAKAGILSNDSFQEFHGQYDWLFEPARLIGGKPVPHVGWVFVERTPVRGPKSRAAVKDAKRAENGEAPATTPGRRSRRGTSSGSPLANEPMPVPTAPPPGRPVVVAEPAPAEAAGETAAAASPAPPSPKSAVNDLVPFLDFVERHPVGTSCSAVIESYSSHGAYARSDSVLVYIPLRLMDDPAPRSARSVLKLGEAVALVVVGYAPERRSIDCALPNMAPAAAAAPAPSAEAQPAKRPRRGSKAAKAEQAEETAAITAAAVAAAEEAAPTTTDAAEPAAVKPSRRRGTKAAAPAADAAPVVEIPADVPADAGAPAPAKRSRSTRAAKAAAPAAEAAAAPEAAPAAKKAPAKKTAAKVTKTAAKKAADAPAASEAPVKKAAKKAPAKKAAAKKTPAKKAAAG